MNERRGDGPFTPMAALVAIGGHVGMHKLAGSFAMPALRRANARRPCPISRDLGRESKPY